MAAETPERAFGKVLAAFLALRVSRKLHVPQGPAARSDNECAPCGRIKTPTDNNSGRDEQNQQDQQHSTRQQRFRAECHWAIPKSEYLTPEDNGGRHDLLRAWL